MFGCETKSTGEVLILKSAKNVYSKFILENKNILSLKEFNVYKIIKTKEGYYFRFWSFVE